MGRRSASSDGPHGILLVDKDPGWTSHDVVAKLRGLFRQRRIGHTGTLDPAATGLLVVCIGTGTRLVEYMARADKTYEAIIELGAATDTDDAEGTVLYRGRPPAPGSLDLREIEARFTGELLQRPPAFSAIKLAGQPAYKAARRGEVQELTPRPVVIHEMHLSSAGDSRLRARIRCGSGTYIRSLARDMGEDLGCGAHLAALRRTAVGPFGISDALTIADIVGAANRGPADRLLLPVDAGVAAMDAAIVTTDRATQLASGQRPRVTDPTARRSERTRVYDAEGRFVAIAEVEDGGILVPQKVFLT